MRELEIEEQAEAVALPTSGPSVEARLALADGKRALAAGRLREARAFLRAALDAEPAYVEALLALAALESRAGRSGPALAACREALAIEPDRIETLTLLANLLWAEPDRAAKEESLALLDRAAALRPDSRAPLRLSASRWAEYGDAPKGAGAAGPLPCQSDSQGARAGPAAARGTGPPARGGAAGFADARGRSRRRAGVGGGRSLAQGAGLRRRAATRSR